MAQSKKRPSKNARAAQKILEESKLLAVTKTNNDSKADQAFKPEESAIKPAAANKMRPNKKRG
jgi:hypothetical protein